MRNKLVLSLLIAALSVSSYGCGSNKGRDTESVESEPVLESYEEMPESITDSISSDAVQSTESVTTGSEKINANDKNFDYFTLEIDETKEVRVPVLKEADNNYNKKSGSLLSEKEGISLSLSLLRADPDKTRSITIDNIRKRAVSSGYENVNVSDGEIANISYDIVKDNTVYPCTVLIKTEDLGDGYILETIITADNTKATENSASLLSMLLDAYGIDIL